MAIFVKIQGLEGRGDVLVRGYEDGNWFHADSFSLGIERELKESGRKGGTEDINIGVGELQECTVSKSMDLASPLLAQFAINGNSCGTAEIDFVEVGGGGDRAPMVYLKYKLERCFIKSWSTSGDADDRPTNDVAIIFNRIAFTYAGSPDIFSWDKVKNTVWTGHGLRPLPAPDF